MTRTEIQLSAPLLPKYVWIGLLLAVVYWLLESTVHVLVFGEGEFFSELLTLDPHEIWKRFLVAGLLIAFSLYAQRGINVRRRTEDALKTSEKKYRTLFQEALNPVFVFDDQGRFLELNQAALEFFECSEAHLLASTLQRLTCPATPSPRQNRFSDFSSGGNIEIDCRVNGHTKTLLVNIVPVTLAGSSLYYGIGQDITSRKQMEKSLELAHAELNQIFDTASSAMRLIDTNHRVLKVNQTFVALSGIPPPDAVGVACHEVFAGETCGTPDCPLTQIAEGAAEVDCEVEKRRSDGTSVPCLLTARPFVNSDNELVGIVESFRDITELKRAQEELRAERDKLHHILFQQFEGVGVVRQDMTIEYQNATLRDQIGDCEGKRCYTVFRERKDPCSRCFMKDAIATGKLWRYEFDASSGRSFELTYTPFTESSGEDKILVLLRDISEPKASRAAAIRAEQLAALGELAAGVAHEINNPINGIINYGQMLANKNRGRAALHEIATQIVKEGDRVARIVESLLSFSRRDKQRPIATPIRSILSESMTLIGAQIRRDGIEVDVDIPDDLPQISCVPQEIQRVFINLLNNARDALNEKCRDNNHPKKLLITATAETTESLPLVRIAFHDLGVGIPGEIIDKVLNPFFSTKPKGKGTGLGLSISHGIVNEHGGKLSIDSVEGQFTKVILELPAIAG